MHTLDAAAAGPLALLDQLAAALTAGQPVLIDHGADISPKRLRAAMVSLSRGLGLRWRQTTGQRLSPSDAPGQVRVIGLYARVPADLPRRDPGRFQSLWVAEEEAPAAWRALSARPGTATLHLGDGPPCDTAAFLAGP